MDCNLLSKVQSLGNMFSRDAEAARGGGWGAFTFLSADVRGGKKASWSLERNRTRPFRVTTTLSVTSLSPCCVSGQIWPRSGSWFLTRNGTRASLSRSDQDQDQVSVPTSLYACFSYCTRLQHTRLWVDIERSLRLIRITAASHFSFSFWSHRFFSFTGLPFINTTVQRKPPGHS